MKRSLLLLTLFFITVLGNAQKYVAEKTYVKFFSDAALEDITAENEKTSSIFNAATDEIVFSVPIREFQFAKSLMQEHFNEKYMESEKFPKATFQGKVDGYKADASGMYDAKAIGKLTIHGVTRNVEIPGTIEKKGSNLIMKTKFIVRLEDYDIDIPQLLWQNIAEQVEVTGEFTFKPH